MSRGIDFKQKQVIDVKTGKILGNVIDVQADFNNGEIQYIVVSRPGRIFTSINNKNNITIPWTSITVIGDDVILVNAEI